MDQPTRGDETRETQIQIEWQPLGTLAEMGGSAVVSYWLEWDAGSDEAEWYDLVGAVSNYVDTSFIVTTDITAGDEYAFRVSALNAHGAGPASDVKIIKASTAPD
jgi:hypothetical protein